MRDEALRALEKDALSDARRKWIERVGSPLASELYSFGAGFEAAYAFLISKLPVESTRQEVAPVAEVGRDGSIIWLSLRMLKSGTKLYTSTGQTSREVAPVAWQYRRRGAGHEWANCPWDAVADLRLGTEFEVRELYTCHTSDARDEVFSQMLSALVEAVDCGMVPVSSALEGGAVTHSRQVHAADRIRAAIDAAMRQEGGNG